MKTEQPATIGGTPIHEAACVSSIPPGWIDYKPAQTPITKEMIAQYRKELGGYSKVVNGCLTEPAGDAE